MQFPRNATTPGSRAVAELLSLTRVFAVPPLGQVAPFEPYSILGLQPGASETDIRKAYRAKSREYHPDKNPDPSECSHPSPLYILRTA